MASAVQTRGVAPPRDPKGKVPQAAGAPSPASFPFDDALNDLMQVHLATRKKPLLVPQDPRLSEGAFGCRRMSAMPKFEGCKDMELTSYAPSGVTCVLRIVLQSSIECDGFKTARRSVVELE